MATPRKRRDYKPKTSAESQSIERLNMNRASMDPRAFREALTRANGAIPGVKTYVTQWNRWVP